MNGQLRRRPGIPTVVLLVESSRASGRDLLRGIAEYARHHGPWAFHWEPGGFQEFSRRLAGFDADGIVLRDVEDLDQVRRRGIPAIVVGHSQDEVGGLANVVTDSRGIAAMAAEHLIDCGFRSFGFVGYEGIPWSDERRDAFQQALGKPGWAAAVYQPARHRAARGRGAAGQRATWRAEQASMADWLRRLPLPTGIMACNDDRAENVSEACKRAGLRVPEDIGILGADNDELVCELGSPPLSSVALNFERAGFEAARLLDRMMRHPGRARNGTIVVAPTHVVPRQSTDIVFMEDMAVARAVRFIRQGARRHLTVVEVARAAGLSRRALERRFRASVGRSVLREIRRVRVEAISRMLLETSRSISEVAMATGFPGVEHFARYFRKERGTTPRIYRREHGRRREIPPPD